MEQAEAAENKARGASGADDMKSRRVTLADGRYLIFYTFDDAPDAAPHIVDEDAKRREPVAQPVATEERHV
ncbi:MAG: hypothetical protein ABR577_12190 [Pyrinomonadaceae bacterium]